MGDQQISSTLIHSIESVAVLPFLLGHQTISFSVTDSPLYRILLRRLPSFESFISIDGININIVGSSFFFRPTPQNKTACLVAVHNMGIEIIAVRFRPHVYAMRMRALPPPTPRYRLFSMLPLHRHLDTSLRKLRVRDHWDGIRLDWERYCQAWLKILPPPPPDAPPPPPPTTT